MKRLAWLSVIAVTSIACSSPGTADVDLGGGGGADLSAVSDLAGPGLPDLGTPDGAPGASLTTLSLLAGKAGGSGNADDIGSVARFSSPQGLAMDAAGNVYVSDSNNNTIRKIVAATGVVTTLAGDPASTSSADGIGTAARFRGPSGLLVDGGDLYVADAVGRAVRKIVLATGAVSTVAGTLNTAGSTDGVGTAARFNVPGSLALEAGSLYVSDATDNTIRRIVLATGAVTTLAGTAGMGGSTDGTGAAARFENPSGLAADGAGNLYVADRFNNAIRKIVLATGAVTTLAGRAGTSGSIDGTGTAARFFYPTGVTTDKAGSLYVTDQFSNRLRKVETATGVVTTLSVGSLLNPTAVTLDGAGAVYVADTGRNTIARLVLASGMLTDVAGGRFYRSSTDGTGSAALFDHPFGVAADASGTLYVTEVYTVRKVTPEGVVTTLAGSRNGIGSADGTGAAAQFRLIRAAATDAAGALYVTDTLNYTIRKIVPATGAVTTVAGQPGVRGSADGTGTAAQFSEAWGLAADTQGNLYVADTNNHTIRKVVLSTGAVTTLAGLAGTSGRADGTGSAARFSRPYGLALDGAGSLYVADSDNATVRRLVLATGEVTTPLGAAGMPGSADGIGTAARFGTPSGLVVVAGTLYVSDKTDNTVRQVSLADLRVSTLVGVSRLSGVKPGPLPARINQPGALAALPDGTLALIDEEENVLLRVR